MSGVLSSVATSKKAAVPATGKKPADGFAGLTADQVGDKAVAATKAARTIRMTGQIRSNGEQMSVGLAVDNKGACTGRLGIEGGNADLRQVNNVMYMKGDAEFWRASLGESGSPGPGSEGVIGLVKGRWIKMPAGSANDMGRVCDLKAMLAELDKNKSDRKGLTKGKDAEVGGRPATTLVKRSGGETTTLYVAKEGEPYLLKVAKTGGDEPGTMLFADYNKPVADAAPPVDEVVDLGNLSGLGTDAGAADRGAHTGTETGSGTDTGTGTRVEPEPEPETGADTGTGTEADTADSGTEYRNRDWHSSRARARRRQGHRDWGWRRARAETDPDPRHLTRLRPMGTTAVSGPR